MDSWVTSLVAGMFSSLIVGVVLSVFQRGLNKSVEDAKEANQLKFSNVEEKISTLSEKSKSMEMKVDNLTTVTNTIDKRVALVRAEQEHLSAAIKGISEDLKQQVKDFGKVIRKP